LKLTEEAGKYLLDTIPDINKTAKLVEEIAASSLEQRHGSTQINSSIQQLNGITQQNASASEELSSSAEELTAQSQLLLDAISFFNTGIKQSSSKITKKYDSNKPTGRFDNSIKTKSVRNNLQSVNQKPTGYKLKLTEKSSPVDSEYTNF